MIYFSSDFHFYHKNIVAGVSAWLNKDKCRKFSTVEEMNNVLITNLNSIIDANDTLYFLGDFAFSGIENYFKIREQINCKKIHFICGNHDNVHGSKYDPMYNGKNVSSLFESYQYYKEIFLNKKRITLFHYPTASWNGLSEPSIHLHGHTHRSPQEKFMNGGLSMDVGVDGNEYKPYSLDDIFGIMNQRVPKVEGHHDKSVDR